MPSPTNVSYPDRFYARPALDVARDLLGSILTRRLPGGRELTARIVEVEAYVGVHDLACHAAKGRTKRAEVLFEAPGRAYVYFIWVRIFWSDGLSV